MTVWAPKDPRWNCHSNKIPPSHSCTWRPLESVSSKSATLHADSPYNTRSISWSGRIWRVKSMGQQDLFFFPRAQKENLKHKASTGQQPWPVRFLSGGHAPEIFSGVRLTERLALDKPGLASRTTDHGGTQLVTQNITNQSFCTTCCTFHMN